MHTQENRAGEVYIIAIPLFTFHLPYQINEIIKQTTYYNIITVFLVNFLLFSTVKEILTSIKLQNTLHIVNKN